MTMTNERATHPMPDNLKPTECGCEADHGPRATDEPWKIPACPSEATLVVDFDGTPIPLCQTCVDDDHMEEPYRTTHRG